MRRTRASERWYVISIIDENVGVCIEKFGRRMSGVYVSSIIYNEGGVCMGRSSVRGVDSI